MSYEVKKDLSEILNYRIKSDLNETTNESYTTKYTERVRLALTVLSRFTEEEWASLPAALSE
jgi:hypothetical protein